MLAAVIVEIAAFALFGALSFVFSDQKGQPLIRRDALDDALYFLVSLLIYSHVTGFIFQHVSMPPLTRMVGAWPVPLQAAVVLVAYDAMQYWLHRGFHDDALWRYHAVHHSAEEIDILTSFRIHPVNFLVYSGGPTIVLLLAGFSPAAFIALAPINFLMGCLTHANLNWTYGPLRYVVSSPMFHRWHHAVVENSRSRNYAPNFPIWDLMFGTFHMPMNERPRAYGAPEVPSNFVGQIAYPFWTKLRA
jgi:sterol desaturase/sphingolipid hydroxylase (fatty acid hydroxylase superfamily)